MSYNIKKTNGEPLFGEMGLPENQVDINKTPLALVGKLTPDYGNYQSENFVHLLENFACDVFPSNPLRGQLAYNTSNNCLYVCVDDKLGEWTKILSIRFEQQSNPQPGDMYYDIESKKLYVYDETVGEYGDWVLIGPSNFKNKKTDATVLETDRDIKTASYSINFDAETSNLVTLKVVACEKMDKDLHPNYGARNPECASWIFKMLVQTYKLSSGAMETVIVGEPNYELIGRTSGEALNWQVKPVIYENMLQINVSGVGDDNQLITPDMDRVDWEIDIEIVKV